MDLPFQWDDGRYISPFVASSEADVEAFAEWLVSRYLSVLLRSTALHARPDVPSKWSHTPSYQMRITDLGCGDATALLTLAQHLRKGWQDLQSPVKDAHVPRDSAFLELIATGVDLDEELLEAASLNALTFASSSSPTSSLVSVETHFLALDLRLADLEVHFPRCPADAVAPCASLTRPPSVLYLYLLPDALVLLLEHLKAILQRGWIVGSNRWPIPGLDDCLRERVGNVHIYYDVPPSTAF